MTVTPSTEQTPANLSVAFKDLDVGYGRNSVLHDISAQIHSGECVAITGNNGSGKSTLIKALVGIEPFQRGSINLLGYTRETGSRPTGNLPWRKVGYVPQRLTASGGVDASVLEVVQAGLLGNGALRPPSDWKRKVKQALEEVGLAHRAHERFNILSGGQQQRCLIARAMVKNPELIVLDEPLAGLDAHNRARLAKIISTHVQSGKTALIVLHELGELKPIISREIRLAYGHIIHDGPCTHTTHNDTSGPWVDESCSSAHESQDLGTVAT